MSRSRSSFFQSRHLLIPAAAAAVILLGLLIEGIFYSVGCYQVRSNPGITVLSPESAEYEGFHAEGNTLVFDHTDAYIRIPLNGQYVRQFACRYEYDGLFNITAEVSVVNEYGEVAPDSVITIQDRNSNVLSVTYLDVHKEADSILLIFSPEQLEEKGLPQYDFSSYPLTVTGFEIDNTVSYNWYRVLLLWGFFSVLAFFFLGRRFISRHIEWGFLAIALTVGSVMIVCLPANKVSWDEEVHFHNILAYASYPQDIHISRPIMMEFSSDIDTWLYNQPDNAKEQALLNEYLNTGGNYKTGENAFPSYIEKKMLFVYLGEAAAMEIGKLLSLPFGVLFRFARFGNLLPYCLLMFLAIRKTPVGKSILTFVALLPTSLYMACTYSYDPVILGCVALFFAMFLDELLAPARPLRLRKVAAMCLIFAAGVMAKAVYAPLLLVLLILPASKFDSKRRHRLAVGIVLAAFFALIASFVLPVLFHPSDTGDIRGGATSEVGQMSYILGHPFAYAVILLRDIIRKIPAFFFGANALGNLGDLNHCTLGWFIPIAMIVVFLTDVPRERAFTLQPRSRAVIVGTVFVTMVLVWTSMYIAFTVPGSRTITGVQGRYCLYFLFPLALALQTPTIRSTLSKSRYQMTILSLCTFICYATAYLDIFRSYCR